MTGQLSPEEARRIAEEINERDRLRQLSRTAMGSTALVQDDLRAIPITLPMLESPGPNGGLKAGDWLAQIKPLIGDVSTAAAGWWSHTMENV